MQYSHILLWMVATGTAATQLGAQVAPATPASWIDDGKSLPQPKLADIGIPRAVGPLKLKRLADFGSARDTYAQYASDDGKIEGTIYLYENSASDAFLAKIATDHVVAKRFGPFAHVGDEAVLSVGGKQGTGFRTIITNGSPPPESGMTGPVTTASVFAQTLFTVIKIRLTGPDDRQADLLRILDELTSRLEFRKKDSPLPLFRAALSFCPKEQDGRPVAVAVDQRLPTEGVTSAGLNLLGGEPQAIKTLGSQPCIVPSSPDDQMLILLGTGKQEDHVIVLLGDSGTTLVIGRCRNWTRLDARLCLSTARKDRHSWGHLTISRLSINYHPWVGVIQDG